MEGDLISRSALKRELIDNYSFFPVIVKNALEKAPSVDAVEVAHGRWITDENGIAYCERCRVIDDYASVHNYCPFCGAKMDGGNEDG